MKRSKGVTNKNAVLLLLDSTFLSLTDTNSPSDVLISSDIQIAYVICRKFKVKRNLNFESSPYGLLKKGLTYMLALKASHASLISVLLSA